MTRIIAGAWLALLDLGDRIVRRIPLPGARP